jgi:hypothetical protein
MTVPFDHTNDHTSVLISTARFENLVYLRVMSCAGFEVPPTGDPLCVDVPPHHYNYSVCVLVMYIASDSPTDVAKFSVLLQIC